MPITPELDRLFSSLMAQVQQGDRSAYDRLLRDVCGFLKSYVERRLGQGPDSEDVVQLILISMHNARHTYDTKKPFGPWIYAIARHRVCDHWRKASREVVLEEPTGNPTDEDLADRLAHSLARLPEKQQRVVDLLKMKGFSIREAAQKLNMTEAAIKVTAHRAYEALRREFEKENDGYA